MNCENCIFWKRLNRMSMTMGRDIEIEADVGECSMLEQFYTLEDADRRIGRMIVEEGAQVVTHEKFGCINFSTIQKAERISTPRQ